MRNWRAIVDVRIVVLLASGCGGGNGGCEGSDQAAPLVAPLPAETVVENGLQVRLTNTGFVAAEAAASDRLRAVLGDHVCLQPDTFSVGVTVIGGFPATAIMCPSVPVAGAAPTCDGAPGCRVDLTYAPVDLGLDQSGNNALINVTNTPNGTGALRLDIESNAVADATCDVALTLDPATLLAVTSFSINAGTRKLQAGIQSTNFNDVIAETGTVIAPGGSCNLTVGSKSAVQVATAQQLQFRLEDAVIAALSDELTALVGSTPGFQGRLVSTDVVTPPSDLQVSQLAGGYVKAETFNGVLGPDPAARGMSFGVRTALNSDATPLVAGDGTSTVHPCVTALPLPTPGSPSQFITGERFMVRTNEMATNTRPDGSPFQGGVQVAQGMLGNAAFHFYNSGRLCASVQRDAADARLTATTLVAQAPSLAALAGADAAVSVELRPAAPPIVTLGSGDAGDPLIRVAVDDLDLELYVVVDDRRVRALTATASFQVGFGLTFDDATGEVRPVLDAALPRAVTGSVIEHELLTEPQVDLDALVPALVELALPKLAALVGPVRLPTVAGLTLDLTTATAERVINGGAVNDEFIAIFADLKAGAPAVARQAVPAGAANDDQVEAPASDEIGAGCAASSTPAQPLLIGAVVLLMLLGRARRRRAVGAIGVAAALLVVAPGCGGCGNDTPSTTADAAPILPCTTDEQCPVDGCTAPEAPVCLPDGTCGCDVVVLADGDVGRFADLAVDGEVAVVVAYNATFGDLVLARATPATAVADGVGTVVFADFTYVDGVPAGPVVADPAGVRGGVRDAGDDVGQDAAIAIDADGAAHLAYLDVTNHALKYARVGRDGVVQVVMTVDADGTDVGHQADIVIGTSGAPQIVYTAPAAAGLAQLRFIAATVAAPLTAADWQTQVVIASSPVVPGEAGVVDRTSGVAINPSMAVRVDGRTRIHYADSVAGDLFRTQTSVGAPTVFAELATPDDPNDAVDGGITQLDVDSGGADLGFVGRDQVVGIDGNDGFHNLFVDDGRGELRYFGTASGFVMTTIDTGVRRATRRRHEVGADLSVAFGDLGAGPQLLVAYQDASSFDAVLALFDSTTDTWSQHTVAGAETPFDGSKGFFTTVVVPPAALGEAWVSTYVIDRAAGTTRLELHTVDLAAPPPLVSE